MVANEKFETLFAVPMTCDGCVQAVSNSLYKLDGVTKVETSLKDQLVRVEGITPPSAIVAAIEATGRDAILRGTGASTSAAVSILETYEDAYLSSIPIPEGGVVRAVRGLARMVEVSSSVTLIDLTLRGVTPGTYRASIREFGDLKLGAASTGSVWQGGGEDCPRGALGTVEVGPDGHGATFLSRPFRAWEVVGHAFVVTRQAEKEAPLLNDADTVVGVIARSAGIWDNDKTVCSCTGKTLWEERKHEVKKGIF